MYRLLFLLILVPTPANALCDIYGNCTSTEYDRAMAGALYQPPPSTYEPSAYGGSLLNPDTSGSIYGMYPKAPTLGDSRHYRKTNPRICTSLLCD